MSLHTFTRTAPVLTFDTVLSNSSLSFIMIDLVDEGEGSEEGEIPAAAQLAANRKKKKEKKSKTELPDASGQGFLNVYGTSATASVEIKTESAIRLVDVQGLVLWALAEAISPRWVFLKVRAARLHPCHSMHGDRTDSWSAIVPCYMHAW